MVGLYKDPEGEKITFVSTINRSVGGESEMKELRRRVTQLENTLKQRVSNYGNFS